MVHIKNNLFNFTPAAHMTSPTPEIAQTTQSTTAKAEGDMPPTTTAEIEPKEPSTSVPAVTIEEQAQSTPSLHSGSMSPGKLERITAWVEETKKTWAKQLEEELAHRPQEATVAPVLEATAYPASQTSQRTNITAVRQPSSVDSDPPPPVPSPRYSLRDRQAHEILLTPKSPDDYYADIVINR